MKPGVGKLDMFPSIWGRKCIPFHFVPFADCRVVDWAGGPGENLEDVKWLDRQLSRFFSDN